MKSVLGWILLALLGFATVLIAQAPARWIVSQLPAGTECLGVQGSLWRGRCNSFRWRPPQVSTIAPQDFGALEWQLQAWPLLLGRAHGQLTWQAAGGSIVGLARSNFSGNWSLSQLEGMVPLDRKWLAALPVGWSGQLQVERFSISGDSGGLNFAEGLLTVRQLRDAQTLALGSYRFEFVPMASAQNTPEVLSARISALDGPLELSGDWQYQKTGQWRLSARLRPKAEAGLGLRQQLQRLGPTDGDGFYLLSVAEESSTGP